MDNGGEIEDQALEFQKIQVFQDRYSEFFYTLISFGSVNQLMSKIQTLKDKGTDFHGVYRFHFYFFFLEQTLDYVDFVEWCASNYSSSERVIMDSSKSKILCPANSLVVRESLAMPYSFTLSQEVLVKKTLFNIFVSHPWN